MEEQEREKNRLKTEIDDLREARDRLNKELNELGKAKEAYMSKMRRDETQETVQQNVVANTPPAVRFRRFLNMVLDKDTNYTLWRDKILGEIHLNGCDFLMTGDNTIYNENIR